MRNLEEFNNKYIDQTCFIIGAGCSLIDVPRERLSDRLTIAVNSGYVFYPATFFLSDDWSVVHWSYFFRDLSSRVSKTIALLYEDNFQDRLLFLHGRQVMFKHRKGYELTSPYSHTDRSKFIWEARTSIGTAIHVAHIMGCSHIVLLGVDGRRCGDYRYFWQLPSWSGNRPVCNDRRRIDNYKKCSENGIPLDTDLRSINGYWEGRFAGTPLKIYNASPISVIKSIPRIKFADALEGKFDE